MLEQLVDLAWDRKVNLQTLHIGHDDPPTVILTETDLSLHQLHVLGLSKPMLVNTGKYVERCIIVPSVCCLISSSLIFCSLSSFSASRARVSSGVSPNSRILLEISFRPASLWSFVSAGIVAFTSSTICFLSASVGFLCGISAVTNFVRELAKLVSNIRSPCCGPFVLAKARQSCYTRRKADSCCQQSAYAWYPTASTSTNMQARDASKSPK